MITQLERVADDRPRLPEADVASSTACGVLAELGEQRRSRRAARTSIG